MIANNLRIKAEVAANQPFLADQFKRESKLGID